MVGRVRKFCWILKIITLTLKADEICLSAIVRFDAKLIMEKVDMRKEACGTRTELTSDRTCIGNRYLLCSQHGDRKLRSVNILISR